MPSISGCESVNAIVKDAPAAGDVHVDGPMGRGKKHPAAPDFGDLGPGRSLKDILDESDADERPVGEIQTMLAKSNEEMYLPAPDAEEQTFSTFFKVAGADEELGLIFGWGLICTEKGSPYTDVQGNTVPEGAMVKAVSDFMAGERQAGEQHERMGAGTIIHSFPLTAEISKAMGIQCDNTGWMVACKPDAAMLKAYKEGKFTGFSIGGMHQEIDGRPVQ